MSETLLSVGVDVGTTSTQMILSELKIENRAGSFAVPRMEIRSRNIRYQSPVHLTPLLEETRVDGRALRRLLELEYEHAGITKDQVDTGAVIITGETSRKENARAVLEALSGSAGNFVVATAGPHLESVLAAKGAGAVAYSEKTGKTVLHMDIGGGTANLARIEGGKITATGCLNVGGRLVKIAPDGKLTYVSPVLGTLFEKKVGDYVNRDEIRHLAQELTRALEMAAGCRMPDDLLETLTTREAGSWSCGGCEGAVLSFSGGVADCIASDREWLAFGDMGPELGRAIRESRLCAGAYILGEQTIRATVIGAGCHSAQLSGSTIFYQNMTFPLKNLPVVTAAEQLRRLDGPGVLALPDVPETYSGLQELTGKIANAFGEGPAIVATTQDAAKALGQLLALRLRREARILCIDRVRLEEGDFLDVGMPLGPALPVVVKTLVLQR